MKHFLAVHLQKIELIVSDQRSKIQLSRAQLLFGLTLAASLASHQSWNLSFDGGVFEFIGSEPARNTGVNPVQLLCAACWVGIIVFILQPLYASQRVNRSSLRRVLELGSCYRKKFLNRKKWLPVCHLFGKMFNQSQFHNRLLGFNIFKRQPSPQRISNHLNQQSELSLPLIETMVLSSIDSEEVANFMEQLEASSADLISISRSAILPEATEILSEAIETVLGIQPVHVPKVELRSFDRDASSVSAHSSSLSNQPILLAEEESPKLWHFLFDAEPVSMPQKSYVVQRSVLLNFLQLLHWSNQDYGLNSDPESNQYTHIPVSESLRSDLDSSETIKIHASSTSPSPSYLAKASHSPSSLSQSSIAS